MYQLVITKPCAFSDTYCEKECSSIVFNIDVLRKVSDTDRNTTGFSEIWPLIAQNKSEKPE